jgi:glyoxylase-like metal-dependent hydrolase (beta-lactamase superfamily II)
MAYYDVAEIYPWLYGIRDPLDDAYCYLAVGKERALLYDSAHGIGDLREAIKSVTDRHVEVVIGHGHLDHCGGAYRFDSVWLHPADFALCARHASEKGRRRNALEALGSIGRPLPAGFDPDSYARSGTGNLVPLEPNRVFDLGGLTMEVVNMEGHTAGSVGLLAREHRVLLAGDATGSHVWLFLRESLSLREYVAMLRRVYELDFDDFFIGHSNRPKPKSDFPKYVNAALNATVEKSRRFPIFPEFGGYLYREDGAEIVFSPEKQDDASCRAS